jgi:hypothetical protein
LSEDDSLKERFSGFVRKPFSQRELFDELADFLPRHAKSETIKKTSGSDGPETESAELAPASKELVSRLRQLLVERWPAIRESMAINESRAFGSELKDLGQRWQCQPLVNYAQKLLLDAENYAVTDLEKHLGEFALLVEQLDRNTNP